MSAHLSMEQLLALREPGTEPGVAADRAHAESCEACRAELDRLDQRVARLKALRPLRPARDAWPAVYTRVAAERRVRVVRWSGLAGLAAAAGLALVVMTQRQAGLDDAAQLYQVATPAPAPAAAPGQNLDNMRARSAALQAVVDRFDPDARVIDGRTALMAAELEDRIASVDVQLQDMQAAGARARADRQLALWRERVGLLDALVDVHVRRASNVGL